MDQAVLKHAALVTASNRPDPLKLSVSQFDSLELCKSLISIELDRFFRLILRSVTPAKTVADFDGTTMPRNTS